MSSRQERETKAGPSTLSQTKWAGMQWGEGGSSDIHVLGRLIGLSLRSEGREIPQKQLAKCPTIPAQLRPREQQERPCLYPDRGQELGGTDCTAPKPPAGKQGGPAIFRHSLASAAKNSSAKTAQVQTLQGHSWQTGRSPEAVLRSRGEKDPSLISAVHPAKQSAGFCSSSAFRCYRGRCK